jgi:hypothetical protein
MAELASKVLVFLWWDEMGMREVGGGSLRAGIVGEAVKSVMGKV